MGQTVWFKNIFDYDSTFQKHKLEVIYEGYMKCT